MTYYTKENVGEINRKRDMTERHEWYRQKFMENVRTPPPMTRWITDDLAKSIMNTRGLQSDCFSLPFKDADEDPLAKFQARWDIETLEDMRQICTVKKNMKFQLRDEPSVPCNFYKHIDPRMGFLQKNFRVYAHKFGVFIAKANINVSNLFHACNLFGEGWWRYQALLVPTYGATLDESVWLPAGGWHLPTDFWLGNRPIRATFYAIRKRSTGEWLKVAEEMHRPVPVIRWKTISVAQLSKRPLTYVRYLQETLSKKELQDIEVIRYNMVVGRPVEMAHPISLMKKVETPAAVKADRSLGAYSQFFRWKEGYKEEYDEMYRKNRGQR